MAIRKLFQSAISAERLAEAQRVFDDACREYGIAASDEVMRQNLAELVIAAYQGSFPADRLRQEIDKALTSLGLRRAR